MFEGCTSLESLNLSGWDVSHVTNMNDMFSGCTALTSLNFSDWNTSGIQGMGYMFSGCTSLHSLDLSSWDVSSVTTTGGMFSGCTTLYSLNLSGWKTASNPAMPSRFLNTVIPSRDDKCYNCVWLPLCGGGCPQMRLFGKHECPPYRNDPEAFVLAMHARIGHNKNARRTLS
jgi:surface protein